MKFITIMLSICISILQAQGMENTENPTFTYQEIINSLIKITNVYQEQISDKNHNEWFSKEINDIRNHKKEKENWVQTLYDIRKTILPNDNNKEPNISINNFYNECENIINIRKNTYFYIYCKLGSLKMSLEKLLDHNNSKNISEHRPELETYFGKLNETIKNLKEYEHYDIVFNAQNYEMKSSILLFKKYYILEYTIKTDDIMPYLINDFSILWVNYQNTIQADQNPPRKSTIHQVIKNLSPRLLGNEHLEKPLNSKTHARKYAGSKGKKVKNDEFLEVLKCPPGSQNKQRNQTWKK